MDKEIIIFGAALDASDFPLNIQMKQAYLHRLHNELIEEQDLLDPYDGMLFHSNILSNDKYIKSGKFFIDSWLTPKPTLEDYSKINQVDFQKATYDGTIKKYSNKLAEYVKATIFPGIPLMIGVDHSLTGGVLSALSKKYGAQNILIVVLDAHFDGIPARISLNIANYLKDHPDDFNSLVSEQLISTNDNFNIKDTYTCASFLYYLLEENIILPENLIILGNQDYPNQKIRTIEDPRIKKYVNYFNLMEENGVTFIRKMESVEMQEKLKAKLDTVDNPYIYISLDVDVGGLKDIIAARFRNAIGMAKSEILNIVKILKKFIMLKKCELIGLDVMEIDIHLLGKSFPKSGRKDLTVEVVDEFLDVLLKH
ncbi:MAG: arginase family protein [Promethearchaeota archaeon]